MIHEDDFAAFDTLVKEKKPNLEMITYTGKNLLQHCLHYDHGPKFIEVIVNSSGLDVNRPDSHNRTTLFEACYLGKYKVAKILLQRGANWRVENPTMFGMNAAQACMFKRKYMC
jgi:ankyrin repeat protein